MTISSSLNAGVAGLNANANRLATISDNIANSGTYGYKRVETDFQSMVLSGQSGGEYSAGGVRAGAHRMIDQDGSLVATSNATDLAVRGAGFLPVTPGASVDAGAGAPELRFATTGSFQTDAEGYLRTESGLNLLGAPAQDGEVAAFPRESAAGLQPIRIDKNSFESEPTSSISLGINLPATATDPAVDKESLSVEYFDTLGESGDLTLDFAPKGGGAPNVWDLTVNSGGNQVGKAELTFDDSVANGGDFASLDNVTAGTKTAPGTLTVGVGSAGQSLALDLGDSTQLSDTFAPLSISKDGAPVGSLVSTEVDENGFVKANYDSGITRTLYQVPLADVPNPNGLTALDEQTYRPSSESGSFYLWDAGAGPTDGIASFAREESTTDVAGELTDLIQTQRAYSSNAKVIQTVDEMLQETTNIKR